MSAALPRAPVLLEIPTYYNWLATGIVAVLSHGCDSISIIFLRVNVYVSFLSDAPARRASAAGPPRRASASSVQWLQCGGGCCSKSAMLPIMRVGGA